MKNSILSLFLILLSTSACSRFSSVQGDGNVVNKPIEVKSFSGIHASGAFDIEYFVSNNYRVELDMDKNLLEFAEVEVKSGILEIGFSRGIENPKKLGVKIYAPKLDDIQLSGACRLTNNESFQTEKMNIDLSGASALELNFIANYMFVNNSGASRTTLKGQADEVRIDLSGASNIDASNMKINELELNTTGASQARVWAVSKLNLIASGASRVLYKGEPVKLKTEVTGAANVSSF